MHAILLQGTGCWAAYMLTIQHVSVICSRYNEVFDELNDLCIASGKMCAEAMLRYHVVRHKYIAKAKVQETKSRNYLLVRYLNRSTRAEVLTCYCIGSYLT